MCTQPRCACCPNHPLPPAFRLQPKLRRGLRAELGAFYPLFVLRPLEQGARAQQQRQQQQQEQQAGEQAGPAGQEGQAGADQPPMPPPPPAAPMLGGASDAMDAEQTDLHTLYVVLSSLRQLFGEPQMVADLFVNYDCDPHAPALLERTVQVRACCAALCCAMM